MKRLFLALAAISVMAACTRNPEVLPPEQLAPLAYRSSAAPSLKLYTVVNRRTNSGAHTALAVNGSETVLFDPAGGFEAQNVVRSGDVIYGFTPALDSAFTSAHARTEFLVTTQTIPVSAKVAEMALQMVKANGPVAPAHCAASTSSILKSLPGFESIEQTYYPKTGRAAGQLPRCAGSDLPGKRLTGGRFSPATRASRKAPRSPQGSPPSHAC